jgi:hypothetical protein
MLKELNIYVGTKFVFEVKLLTGDECMFLVVKSDKSLA